MARSEHFISAARGILLSNLTRSEFCYLTIFLRFCLLFSSDVLLSFHSHSISLAFSKINSLLQNCYACSILNNCCTFQWTLRSFVLQQKRDLETLLRDCMYGCAWGDILLFFNNNVISFVKFAKLVFPTDACFHWIAALQIFACPLETCTVSGCQSVTFFSRTTSGRVVVISQFLNLLEANFVLR